MGSRLILLNSKLTQQYKQTFAYEAIESKIVSLIVNGMRSIRFDTRRPSKKVVRKKLTSLFAKRPHYGSTPFLLSSVQTHYYCNFETVFCIKSVDLSDLKNPLIFCRQNFRTGQPPSP